MALAPDAHPAASTPSAAATWPLVPSPQQTRSRLPGAHLLVRRRRQASSSSSSGGRESREQRRSLKSLSGCLGISLRMQRQPSSSGRRSGRLGSGRPARESRLAGRLHRRRCRPARAQLPGRWTSGSSETSLGSSPGNSRRREPLLHAPRAAQRQQRRAQRAERRPRRGLGGTRRMLLRRLVSASWHARSNAPAELLRQLLHSAGHAPLSLACCGATVPTAPSTTLLRAHLPLRCTLSKRRHLGTAAVLPL